MLSTRPPKPPTRVYILSELLYSNNYALYTSNECLKCIVVIATHTTVSFGTLREGTHFFIFLTEAVPIFLNVPKTGHKFAGPNLSKRRVLHTQRSSRRTETN
jgi:hypothetical protein